LIKLKRKNHINLLTRWSSGNGRVIKGGVLTKDAINSLFLEVTPLTLLGGVATPVFKQITTIPLS